MKKIIINQADVDLDVQAIDCPTLRAIDKVLPITSTVKVWGDEIYCDTDIDAPAHPLTADLNVGDVAYWPEGRCICLFFGRTPLSVTEQPVPASEVVLIAHADIIDKAALRKVGPGTMIKIC